jgi:hypothetical protein
MENDSLLQDNYSDKRQIRPLVREAAPQIQGCNCQTVINIFRHQDLLTVSRNVTLTLTDSEFGSQNSCRVVD